MKKTLFALALVATAQITNAASITYDFDATTPSISGGNFEIVQGTSSGNYAAPYGSSGVDATKYLTVYRDGIAIISFGGTYTSLSLLWGSIDSYNTITLFNNGSFVTSITGDQVLSGANGNQGPDGTLTFVVNEKFDTAFFSSGANSFELDDLTVSRVPEAGSTLALLGGALTLVSAINRKNRK
jgi:hypothetical protein